ncbi:MAG: hypothetical protein WC284_14925 [Candidimonas sp.]
MLFKNKIPADQFVGHVRRFIYVPKNGILLGTTDTQISPYGSHAEDYYEWFKSNQRYDETIRGWLVFDGKHKYGMISFTPQIDKTTNTNDLSDFLGILRKSGISDKAKIIGIPNNWEMTIGEFLSEDRIDLTSWTTNRPFRVYYNPSEEELISNIPVRGLIDDDGNLYAWDSEQLHHHVIEQLNLMDKYYKIIIDDDYDVVISLADMPYEKSIKMALKNNKILKNLR